MKSFRILFLRLSLIGIVLNGCASDYRSLRPVPPDLHCIHQFKPAGISTAWYRASVDVTGKHLSGLLLIKNMQDSSQRIVFTNEAGVTFFDFEFGKTGIFRVRSIIGKMDRKPVVRTLQKDFALLLGWTFRSGPLMAWSNGDENFYGVRQKKETSYFITNKECSSLHRLELGSVRKRKVTLTLNGAGYPLPDTVSITHHNFPMQIRLLHFEKE